MIKKRNLDNSLIQWIMTVTGLGPGIGEIKYVAPAISATSQYRRTLYDMNVPDDDIFTLPSLAEDACTAYRNDVVLLMPGCYTETAMITWDKANTHMIGLASDFVQTDYSEPSVAINTTTADVVATLYVGGSAGAGKICMFKNFTVSNKGADVDNVAALKANAKGCSYENLFIQGIMTSTQAGDVDCCSLAIHSYAKDSIFKSCKIGDAEWQNRTTANQGQLNYSNTGGWPKPMNITYDNCDFWSRSETATVPIVSFPNANCADRNHVFKRCTFTNFYTDHAANLNQVFYEVSGMRTFYALLMDCMMTGYDEWQDGDYGNIMSNMGVATAGGGIMIEPTATIS